MPEVFKSLNESKLITVIKSGKVGVLPTDTVYGLVCAAASLAAVEQLYGLKNRQNKPGTIIAASIDQLVSLGIKRSYVKAVEQFWPGPVSVVIPFSDPAGAYLRQDLNTIAVRIPKNKALVRLMAATGPLLTSSANPPGQKPADNIKQAQDYFQKSIDFYVDGGDLSGRQPSTVIRIIDDAVEVLRPGAVKIINNSIAND